LERIFSVIGGLFGIGLFVFAKPIMLIIFWEKYLPSAPILQASSLFIVVNFLLQIRLIILAGIWGTRARIHIFTIGIFYNLWGIIAAIVLWKLLIGSYWATVVCAGVVGISWIPILLLAGKKIQQFNISLPWNTIMSQIVILWCGIFFGWAFSYFEIAQSRLELFILIILTMITTLWWLIWMNKDELLQLKKSLMK
jgi:O-antigen/teichoic acid export membrane protein